MSNTKGQPNNPTQQGAPQETQTMPSSGNSRETTRSNRGTDESTPRSQDVERSGMTAMATERAADTAVTGDPGRTPGSAEGVENPEVEGNE